MYTLLKQLGYKPAIVTSDAYRHAMLAVDIPAGGDYITDRGIKYYFWETTAKNWEIGVLPFHHAKG